MQVIPVMTLRSKKFSFPCWKKVLYQQQPFDDNYTHHTFLAQLRKNVNLREYSWSEAALPLCAVTLEMCCTLLFVTSFVFLDQKYITPCQLISYSLIFIVVFLFLSVSTGFVHELEEHKISVSKLLKNGLVLLACGYAFSPVLRTLTESISTDTIYAMVAIMLCIHVLFQDYFPSSKLSYNCLSLNSALFAAVCLASRLSTIQHTFSLITFAVQAFTFTPCLRFVLQGHSAVLVCFTGLLSIIVCGFLTHVQPVYAALFGVSCAFINLLCPSIFVKYQVYKQNIYGPWDEAVIREDDLVLYRNARSLLLENLAAVLYEEPF